MGLVLESTVLELVSALAILICSFVYYYFTTAHDYWKKKGVPFFTPSIPFGNFKDLMLMRVSQAEGFQKFYNEAGGLPYIGLYQIRKPWLLIRDPQLIKHILVKDFTHFHDRGISFDEEREPLSQHLLNLGGTKWRGLRAKLTPTFTSGKMKMMFSLISGCAEELGKYLESPAQHGEALEIREVMAKFTTDVIGTCAFGLQFNSMKDPDSEFRAMGRKVFQFTAWKNVKRTMRSLAPSLLRLLRLKVMDEDVEQFFINAVKETINYREQNGITRNDFLQLLIQLKHKGKVQDDDEMDSSEDVGSKKHVPNGVHKEDNIEFTDNLLSAQAFIFFLAGFETSSTTLSFCLYELALNPDVQTKLRKEINTTLQEAGGISYECIQGMTYLSKVVDETLRKYPPGANLIRIVTKPYTLPDTSIHLEKGRNVVVPVYGLHHDPEYFPNPEQFNPENFSDEAKAKRPHYAYLPFGEGPRNCIGLRFGLLQVKVGLAVLLSNYQFSTCEKTRIPLKLDPKQFIPTPIGGVWIRINKLEEISSSS